MFQSYNQDRRQQLVVANTSHSDIITYTADSDNSRALQLFSNSELVQSSNGQINADKVLQRFLTLNEDHVATSEIMHINKSLPALNNTTIPSHLHTSEIEKIIDLNNKMQQVDLQYLNCALDSETKVVSFIDRAKENLGHMHEKPSVHVDQAQNILVNFFVENKVHQARNDDLSSLSILDDSSLFPVTTQLAKGFITHKIYILIVICGFVPGDDVVSTCVNSTRSLLSTVKSQVSCLTQIASRGVIFAATQNSARIQINQDQSRIRAEFLAQTESLASKKIPVFVPKSIIPILTESFSFSNFTQVPQQVTVIGALGASALVLSSLRVATVILEKIFHTQTFSERVVSGLYNSFFKATGW